MYFFYLIFFRLDITISFLFILFNNFLIFSFFIVLIFCNHRSKEIHNTDRQTETDLQTDRQTFAEKENESETDIEKENERERHEAGTERQGTKS